MLVVMDRTLRTTAPVFGWGLGTVFLAQLNGLQKLFLACGETKLPQEKPAFMRRSRDL